MAATLQDTGPGTPPRLNGELVFAEPWEGRAFGLAMTMAEAGVFEWEVFRGRLIEALAEAERNHATAPFSYYRCWLAALERVLADQGALDGRALEARVGQLAARHADHDHDHHR